MSKNRGNGRIDTRPEDQQAAQIPELNEDFSRDSITSFSSDRRQDVNSGVSDDSQQAGQSSVGIDDNPVGIDDNPVLAPVAVGERRRRQRGHGSGRSDKRDRITGTNPSGGGNRDNSGYQFDTDGGTVVNLRRVRRGVSRLETIEQGETWRFDGVHLVQTEQHGLGTTVTTYADSDGDRLFSRIGETFTPLADSIPGGA